MSGDLTVVAEPALPAGTPAASLRRVVGHAGQLLAGDAASRLLLFATSAYLARTVGVEFFGLLAFAQVLLAFLSLVADWGLGTSGVREIARHPHDARLLAGEYTRLRVAVACVVTALSVAVVAAWPWDRQVKGVVAVTLLATIPMAAVPDYVLRGLERMAAASTVAVLSATFLLLGVLLAVHGPEDVVKASGVRVVAAAATAVAAHLLVGRIVPLKARESPPARGIRMASVAHRLRVGTVLLIANLAVLAHSNIDVVLVRGLLGNGSVGLYSAAYRLIQLPMGAFYSLTAAALPALIRSGGRALEGRLTVAAAVLGVAAGSVVWALRAALLRLVYGPAYLQAAPVLGILAAAVPLDFVIAVKGTSYVARGWESQALVCVVVAAAANVIANLLLIPRHGLGGAATATVVSYAILLGGYVLWVDRRGRR